MKAPRPFIRLKCIESDRRAQRRFCISDKLAADPLADSARIQSELVNPSGDVVPEERHHPHDLAVEDRDANICLGDQVIGNPPPHTLVGVSVHGIGKEGLERRQIDITDSVSI